MKQLILFLAFTASLCAQSVTIGKAVYCPGCSHLNDAASGGLFTNIAANHSYVVTISATEPRVNAWHRLIAACRRLHAT